VFFASNLDSAGAVFNPITNGYELDEHATFSAQSLVPDVTFSLNWVSPASAHPRSGVKSRNGRMAMES
jgi:hypothetical protein